jgi:YD repeat-containing protein
LFAHTTTVVAAAFWTPPADLEATTSATTCTIGLLGRLTAATTADGSYAFTFDGDGGTRARVTRARVGHLVSDSSSSSALGKISTDYRDDNPGALL